MNYKNWSLTAFFQGVLGNKILNATKAHYSFQGHLSGGKNVLAEVVNDKKWQADANAHIPSDKYIENGSYLRLSTLTLGYTFKNLADWAQSVQLYATCNNVFTITGYSGIDPEVNLGGLILVLTIVSQTILTLVHLSLVLRLTSKIQIRYEN